MTKRTLEKAYNNTHFALSNVHETYEHAPHPIFCILLKLTDSKT